MLPEFSIVSELS